MMEDQDKYNKQQIELQHKLNRENIELQNQRNTELFEFATFLKGNIGDGIFNFEGKRQIKFIWKPYKQ